MVDIFSTFVLNRTVEHLERPASFLLDTFFGSIQTEESEEIHFDIDQSKPRLAPFVSPLVAGRVVANEGFTTQSFKPAYVKDMIEDVQNEKCTDAELEALLNAFEYTVKKMAATLARKSWYALEDYATAKQYGIDRFTLMIERKEALGQEQWHGAFEYGSKNLKVIGTLEK